MSYGAWEEVEEEEEAVGEALTEEEIYSTTERGPKR